MPNIRNTFARRFWPLFLLGLVGLASLPLSFAHLLAGYGEMPELQHISPLQLAMLSLVQPLILLAIFTAIGAALAHTLGFFSHVAAYYTGSHCGPSAFRSQIVLSVAMGAVIALSTLLLDKTIFEPQLTEFFEVAGSRQPRSLSVTVSGILYGGITEELISRWGAMSLFVWLGWKIFQRRQAQASSTIVIAALVLSAILFGVLHLPAAAAFTPLNEWLIARTILLNALAGIVYGWLFWRRSLESAMLAHAATHVFLSIGVFAGLT